jgi:large subunit ribosomal protein L10
MAITKQKKVAVVDDLTSNIASAQSVTFVAFDKMTMVDVSDLRRKLADGGVKYQVVKKTLLGHALKSKGATGEMPALDGNIAITWSETDPTASARELHNWHTAEKNRKDLLSILGGIFEGKFMNKSEMMEIATIPDQKTLRGMFVNIINTPIQQLVIALDKIAEKKA